MRSWKRSSNATRKRKTISTRSLKDLSPEERRLLRARIPYIKPKTPDELHMWVEVCAGVYIPRARVCEGHSAPFDVFSDAYFAKTPATIWKGARALVGKTFTTALLGYTEMCTLGAWITMMGGSSDQSKILYSYLSGTNPRVRGTFWEAPKAPKELLQTDPTATEIKLSNGGRGRALSASPQHARGVHPHRVRCDEIDEMDVAIFDAATGQAMAGGGIKDHFLATSTWQHPDGTFAYAWELADELNWSKHETCYREVLRPHGWLTQEEKERKRHAVSRETWRVEYELGHPASEDLIFSEETLEQLFDKSLGEFEGAVGEEIVVVPPPYPWPDPPPLMLPDDHFETDAFSHGTDWGKTRHFTVVHSMKKNRGGPDTLAAWGRWGRGEPWHLMADRHNERIRRYGGVSYHDATGVGDVTSELLNVPSYGWDFHRQKDSLDMKNSYVRACEGGEIVYPKIRSLYKDHRKLTREMLYGNNQGSEKRHTPDSIIAASLEREARATLDWPVLIGRI